MKKTFLFTALFLTGLAARSQNADPLINILMDPPAVQVANGGNLRVDIINAGADTIVKNSLEITIGMSTNGEILGLAPASSAAWTVSSITNGTNNTIKLRNTANGIGADSLQQIVLSVRGNVVGSASTITGNVVYIAANNPDLTGTAPNASQGNASTSNDNSTTSLAVTAGPPLPIGYSTFSGAMSNCTASLSWAVNTAKTYDHFTIEQSKDGRSFTVVTEIKAELGRENYVYELRQESPRVYYRLKLTDRGGAGTYTNVLTLNADCMQGDASLSPNPTRGSIRLTGLADGGGIRIYNQAGMLIRQQTNGSDVVDLSPLPTGLYRVSWDTKAGVVTQSVTRL